LFKFISKCVCNRLTEIAGDVIFPTHTAFIPGRLCDYT
ncbi:Os10g0344550, partial [Oryza sativa Japonica Group]